jgi:hypothetical protein
VWKQAKVMRGLLFVSVFNPFMLVLVAIPGSSELDEKLDIGRYCVFSSIDSVSILFT